MRKNNRLVYTFVLSCFILVHSACAQLPIPTGQAYVNEEQQVEKSTSLFNNQQRLVPLSDLAELKIASIHFTYAYAAGFDSLLNKYAKVDTFKGTDYVTVKTLGDLDFDTKHYNTLIVQLDEQDLANPQIIGFIHDNVRIK
ncbi:MAG: beta-N-acetylglucosaminidase, partial [Bacteroidetes bacterium]|nr:beta-N-acetylglucosaminidase [Bacteroidota bacterium]